MAQQSNTKTGPNYPVNGRPKSELKGINSEFSCRQRREAFAVQHEERRTKLRKPIRKVEREMDPKLTEVSQSFERFKAAFTRNDFDTCTRLLSQLKVTILAATIPIRNPSFSLCSSFIFKLEVLHLVPRQWNVILCRAVAFCVYFVQHKADQLESSFEMIKNAFACLPDQNITSLYSMNISDKLVVYLL